jgi:hypothetical protein
LHDLSEIEVYIKRRVIVLYGGALAEALRNSFVKRTQALEDFNGLVARNDFSKISELLLLLAGINSEGSNRQERLNRYVQEYSDLATQLVEKHAQLIRSVAEEVFPLIPGTEGSISKGDIERLPSIMSIVVGSER